MWRLVNMNSETNNICQKGIYITRGLLLQWHIMERCNLRCAHCSQKNNSGEGLRFQYLLEVVHLLGGS